MDGAALTLVDCAPMAARMTEAACVKRWRAAQGGQPPAWDSLRHCHTCTIGALRAGAPALVATNAALVAAVGNVCPRCERLASRLINGRSCVSCYNRTREVMVGANAKGTRPRMSDVIHAEALAITRPAGDPRVLTVERVTTRMEAAAIAARQAGPGAIIGVPPLLLPLRGWQGSLYLVSSAWRGVMACEPPRPMRIERVKKRRGQVPLRLLDMMGAA